MNPICLIFTTHFKGINFQLKDDDGDLKTGRQPKKMKPHPKEDQKEGRGLGQEKKIIIIKKGKGEFLLGMSHNTM